MPPRTAAAEKMMKRGKKRGKKRATKRVAKREERRNNYIRILLQPIHTARRG